MRRSRIGDLLVEPRVLDRAGDLRRQQRQRPHVIVGEEWPIRLALQVHHADHAVVHDQRHGHLRADIRMRSDVARIRQRYRARARPPAISAAAPVIPLPSGTLSMFTRSS